MPLTTARTSRRYRFLKTLGLFLVCWIGLSACSGGDYRVYYDANGADCGTVPVDDTLYASEELLPHLTEGGVVQGNTGDLARSGYAFANWRVTVDVGSWSEKNLEELFFSGGDSFDFTSNLCREIPCNYTFYAQWTPVSWDGVIQFGTSSDDDGYGIAVDSSGDLYVTGETKGALTGTNAGDDDVFLTKYDYGGSQQWMVQIGTSKKNSGRSVAVDSSENVYVTGSTAGALTGTNAGEDDVFLTKYNSCGTQQWMKQIGTGFTDFGQSVAVDSSGNAYVTGYTQGDLAGTGNLGESDLFVSKYNSSGTQQWIKQIGTSGWEYARGIAVDSSGNAYVTGYTTGALTGANAGLTDIFLTKYNSSGIQQWIKQIGTSVMESGTGVAVDSSGNAYVTGYTEGDLGGTGSVGAEDIFLAKYNSSGAQQWIKQTGTSADDTAYGVAIDSSGNAYVTGSTSGALGGTNTGGGDIFLTKYNSSGIQQWVKQTGTSDDEEGKSVAVDSSENVYVTGQTAGALTGTNAGEDDVFLLKYDTDGNLQ